MTDKYLKIFGLDNTATIEDIESRYQQLLKEFDTENIDEGLKIIFLEQKVKIQQAYQILLKYYNEKGGFDTIVSSELPTDAESASAQVILPKKIPIRPIPNKIRNKRNQLDKLWKTLILIALGVLLLMIGGIFYYDQHPSKEADEKKEKPKQITEEFAACADTCSKACCLGCRATEGQAYCLNDQSCCDATQESNQVRIINSGDCYTTINNFNCIEWPSPSIKKLGGRSSWGDYYPKNGDIGKIIFETTHCATGEKIYIVEIDGYYVPIGWDGVEKIIFNNISE